MDTESPAHMYLNEMGDMEFSRSGLILTFSLVASLGKYAFRIQDLSLFTD